MRVKGKWSKGEMARTIVLYLLQLITTVIVWACALKTVAVLIAVIRNPELGASSTCPTYSALPAGQPSQSLACLPSSGFLRRKMKQSNSERSNYLWTTHKLSRQ